jgi:hypothetical protein
MLRNCDSGDNRVGGHGKVVAGRMRSKDGGLLGARCETGGPNLSARKLGLVSSLAPGCARIFWSVSEHETTPDTTIGTLATTVFGEVQRWRGRNKCSRMFDIRWPQPLSCRIQLGRRV